MNKKLKLILISSLVTVSSIGIILPIVSCSSSRNSIIINHSNDENVKEALALAIAKIGNPSAGNTNSEINSKQFKQIIKEYTSSDSKVWNALGNFFTFDSGLSFNDVVEKAVVSGSFGYDVFEIKVKIVLTLKKEYVASDSSKLTLNDLKIGLANHTTPGNNVTFTQSEDQNVKEAFALEIVRIANPDAINTNGIINQDQFSKIKGNYNKNNTKLWKAAKEFFIINSGHIFDDVVENIAVSGTLGVPGSLVNVEVVLSLKSGFLCSSCKPGYLKLGIVANYRELIVTHSNDPSVKDALALAIAKTANSSATNTNGNLNEDQFNIINNKEYYRFNIDVWTALGNFFTFDSGISFNDVVKKATISGEFGAASSEVKVKIVLILKNDYVATDISKLTLSNLKIGLVEDYIKMSYDLSITNLYSKLEELRILIARNTIMDGSINDTNQFISKQNLENLYKKVFLPPFSIFTVLDEIIKVTPVLSQTPNTRTFLDVVESLRIQGPSYPEIPGLPIFVTLVWELKPNIFLSADSKLENINNLQIGVSK